MPYCQSINRKRLGSSPRSHLDTCFDTNSRIFGTTFRIRIHHTSILMNKTEPKIEIEIETIQNHKITATSITSLPHVSETLLEVANYDFMSTIGKKKLSLVVFHCFYTYNTLNLFLYLFCWCLPGLQEGAFNTWVTNYFLV